MIRTVLVWLAAAGLLLASLAAGSYIRASAAAQRAVAEACGTGGAPLERTASLSREGAAGWTFAFRRGGGAWARVRVSPGGTVLGTEPAELRAWEGCAGGR